MENLNRRCTVTVSRRDALRIAEAARRAGNEGAAWALEDAAADVLDGQDVTVTPRLETARWIIYQCWAAGIGAGVRFVQAASEAEFKGEGSK